MTVASRTGMGAVLVLIVLLLSYVGSTGTPAFAQYDVPPDGQYGQPPEEQYGPPPAGTVPLPEDQDDAPPGDQNGGGGTDGDNGATMPVDGGNGGDREAGIGTPNQRSPSDGGLPGYLEDGFLVDALGLFAVLSLITTVFFLLERRKDRLGR